MGGGSKKFDPEEFAKTLPGITEPLGFFDPLGLCSGINAEKPVTEGKVRFYREVELKHCRVAMLAALGYPIAEQFHPLFGGNSTRPRSGRSSRRPSRRSGRPWCSRSMTKPGSPGPSAATTWRATWASTR